MAPAVCCSIQLRDGQCRSRPSSTIVGESKLGKGGVPAGRSRVWLEDAEGEVQPEEAGLVEVAVARKGTLSPAPFHDRLQTQTYCFPSSSSTWTQLEQQMPSRHSIINAFLGRYIVSISKVTLLCISGLILTTFCF